MSILDRVRDKYKISEAATDKTDRSPTVGNGGPCLTDSGDIIPAAQEAERVAGLIAEGIVPRHYTNTTVCRKCGPVPIFEGCPPDILGCPWCWAGSSPQIKKDTA